MLKRINKETQRILFLFLLSYFIIIFPFIMACGSPALSAVELPYSQEDALLPGETGEASRLPDIPHYDLKIAVDMEEALYEGSAVIDYTNLEDTSLSSIFLRLIPNGGGTYGNGSIEVEDLNVNGKSFRTLYSLEDSAVEVVLDRPLEPGAHIIISCDFKGRVPEDFDGGGYGIFNLKQGVMSLAAWYPIISVFDEEGWNVDPVSSIGDSVYSDIAYYTVEITLAGGLQHAATGTMVSESSQGGDIRYRYVSGPVRDFFIMVGEELEVKKKKAGNITINAYYREQNSGNADMTLDIAAESLRTFNEKFGSYPYNELDIVEAPMNGSIAVEFPGIIVVGSQVFGNAVFTSHEVAHQWWYNVVGNDVIDDPWLDEALTTYSSIIYYEANRSVSEYRGLLDYFAREDQKTVSAGDDHAVTEGLDHFEELGGRLYSRIVYTRGALFYHQLRLEIGDKAFFDALRDYYSDLKYDIAQNNDILDRFEEFSGRDLEGFYREWLY